MWPVWPRCRMLTPVLCALSVHPACVVSIMLTHLRTGRQHSGDTSGGGQGDHGRVDIASLIMNMSGKLVLIQRDYADSMTMGHMTGLSTRHPPCWPALWVGLAAISDWQQQALHHPGTVVRWQYWHDPHRWRQCYRLYCGAAGMRVESVAAIVSNGWREQSQLHGQEDHAPLPMSQHLTSPDPVWASFDAGVGQSYETQIYLETSDDSPTDVRYCHCHHLLYLDFLCLDALIRQR